MSIHRRQDVLAGSFTGTLAGISLDRIVSAKQLPETRVTGDLTYRIPLKQPRDFRANGELRVNRLTSLAWPSPPLRLMVQNATIKAADRSLHLVTSFSAHDTNFDVSGTIRGTDQRYALDIDVKSDSVDVERLLAAYDQRGDNDPKNAGPRGTSRSKARCGWRYSRCVTAPTHQAAARRSGHRTRPRRFRRPGGQAVRHRDDGGWACRSPKR